MSCHRTRAGRLPEIAPKTFSLPYPHTKLPVGDLHLNDLIALTCIHYKLTISVPVRLPQEWKFYLMPMNPSGMHRRLDQQIHARFRLRFCIDCRLASHQPPGLDPVFADKIFLDGCIALVRDFHKLLVTDRRYLLL